MIIGKDTSNEERINYINNLVNNDYLIQEFVENIPIEVPMYKEGDTITKKLHYDICPHFFIQDNKVIGVGHILMRFSENKILNVFQ